MQRLFPQWLTGQLKTPEHRDLRRGDRLFRAGDPVTRLYLLHSGEIHLVRPLRHGDFLTLHRALPGTLLAEASLFAAHYHCDAIADRDSRVLCYERKKVQQRLRAEPGGAENLCADFSREIQVLRTKLELAHIKSADERLLTWIRLQVDLDTLTLTVDRSLKTIASELGLAHETLYRSLKHLEKRGIIRRQPGRILLTGSDRF